MEIGDNICRRNAISKPLKAMLITEALKGMSEKVLVENIFFSLKGKGKENRFFLFPSINVSVFKLNICKVK